GPTRAGLRSPHQPRARRPQRLRLVPLAPFLLRSGDPVCRHRNPDGHPPVAASRPRRSRSGAEGRMTAALFLLAPLLLGATADVQEPRLPFEPTLTIGEVLRAAMERNPDLLNAIDTVRTARVAERGVFSTFLPQVSPFYTTDRSRDSSKRTDSYGFTASELFPFGTRIDGGATVTRVPGDP